MKEKPSFGAKYPLFFCQQKLKEKKSAIFMTKNENGKHIIVYVHRFGNLVLDTEHALRGPNKTKFLGK